MAKSRCIERVNSIEKEPAVNVQSEDSIRREPDNRQKQRALVE